MISRDSQFCHLFIFFSFSFFLAQQDYPLNPKAMSLAELYGETDLSTNEWADGVLSSLMRLACAGADTKNAHCCT